MRKAILVLLLLFSAAVRAQEVLDNAAVVRLVRSGLGADVVILKIERTNAAFDTSATALVDLKSANVPDAVIKAMLLKAPSPAPPPLPPPVPPPAPPPVSSADELCVKLDYYTSGNEGWAWIPANVCASKTQLTVDEQTFSLQSISVHCLDEAHHLSFGGITARGDYGWRFSDRTQTYQFRGKGDDAKHLYDFLAAARSELPHGDCGSKDVRALMKPVPRH